jgi:hypothetical protein
MLFPQEYAAMISALFYDDWIRNTKSPYFRGTLLKRLDTALQAYCAAAGPLTAPALITAWDNWQESKALKGGWFNSERNTLSTNSVVVRLANEMQALKPAAGVARGAVCYDSPHLTRAVNQAAPLAIALNANALAVWGMSRTAGYRGDSFIGITQRSTGICYMLPTYQRVDRAVIVPPSRIPRIPNLTGASMVESVIYNGAGQRSVAQLNATYGAPPGLGVAGVRNYIIGEWSPNIDGYYHRTLCAYVMVPEVDALGWALQGNAALGNGQFRFVSGRNLGVFDLGNPAGHEPRDLPPVWAKAISDCVADGLHVQAAAAFTHGTSGANHRTHTRTFEC